MRPTVCLAKGLMIMKHLRMVSKNVPARAWWWTWFIEIPTLLGGSLGKFRIPDVRSFF